LKRVPRERIRSGSDVSLPGHVMWCNATPLIYNQYHVTAM
jgi:hypothetical protein